MLLLLLIGQPLYHASMMDGEISNDAAVDNQLGLADLNTQSASAGLPLDEISEALVDLMQSGHDPYGELPSADDTPPSPGPDSPDDPLEVSPRTILEAMLFVGNASNRPLTSREIAGLMRGVRPAEIDDLVIELNARYAADNCPYEIVGAGAGYRLALRDSYARMRDKFYGRARDVTLSQSSVEVLAIVAYNQPVTRDDVGKLRGHPSGGILNQLVRRQLLRLERPVEKEKGRAPLYFTTDRFLQLFGLTTLDDLPRSDDLEKQ